MYTLFIDGLGIFVIYVGLKLETNDNLETMFLPIIMVFVIQILCTWCEYTTANKQCLKQHVNFIHRGIDVGQGSLLGLPLLHSGLPDCRLDGTLNPHGKTSIRVR